MGNQQPGARRDRDGAEGHRGLRGSGFESGTDTQPVNVQIAKYPDSVSSHSTQYIDTHEYPVVIKWGKRQAHAKSVCIAGSWTQWKERIPLVRSHDDFSTIVNLPEGRHEFKFLVDGVWQCDEVYEKTDNSVGSENNVIVVDEADFEVFDALDRDFAESAAGQQPGTPAPPGGRESRGSMGSNSPRTSVSEGGVYNQDVPERRAFDSAQHPPVLPPHLLQVILNKDTPMQCDPNVLPEPNHVMLNHLYALSIKDGVMVLSATHRYRKKYVTTLLYKPITS